MEKTGNNKKKLKKKGINRMFRLHCQNHKDPENKNTSKNVNSSQSYCVWLIDDTTDLTVIFQHPEKCCLIILVFEDYVK